MERPPFSFVARVRSFGPAVRGVAVLLATQHNARVHLTAATAALAAGTAFGLSRLEWAAVAAACGLVLTAEAMNTAVERLGDAVTLERHPLIRDAKDVAAAAVLLASVAAAAIGLLVFAPHVLTLLMRVGLATA